MQRMSATDVARNFSAMINRVSAGEEIEIVRNGAAVAQLRRASRPRRLQGEDWRSFIGGLPPIDVDFARDVQNARGRIEPPVGKWPAG
jgi:antitoxin (DNA-binding transcriptional repressor) of toxin-antitoxin stability system